MENTIDNLFLEKESETHLYLLASFSAIDRYMGFPSLPFIWIETDADLTTLAKTFENLRFPGKDIADAALDIDEKTYYFYLCDPDYPAYTYKLLSLTQNMKTLHFYDRKNIYPILRTLRNRTQKTSEKAECWWKGLNPETKKYKAIMDSALILSRYGTIDDENKAIKEILFSIQELDQGILPKEEEQRVFLTTLLCSIRPDLGFELLKRSGFLERVWAELAFLDNVDHSKEFHPEGNVWKHTMETFRYRKKLDFRLSLGLLLHDIGKADAKSSGNRRFDGHAEIGAKSASKFLKRLGFDENLIKDIHFLVRNHMITAALPRLPLTKSTEAILKSPLFPTLLELYRCDEASSFKELEGYYKSSALYKTFLKRNNNPYRELAFI